MSQEYSATITLDDGREVEVEKAHAAIMAVARRNSKKTPVMNLNVNFNGVMLSGNDILNIMEAYEQIPLDSHQNMQHQMMERDLKRQEILRKKRDIEEQINELKTRLSELNTTLQKLGFGQRRKGKKGKKGKSKKVKKGKKGKSKKKGKKGGTRKR